MWRKPWQERMLIGGEKRLIKKYFKKVSSKEISREVSTHKIEINGLQSKDIKKDL